MTRTLIYTDYLNHKQKKSRLRTNRFVVSAFSVKILTENIFIPSCVRKMIMVVLYLKTMKMIFMLGLGSMYMKVLFK